MRTDKVILPTKPGPLHVNGGTSVLYMLHMFTWENVPQKEKKQFATPSSKLWYVFDLLSHRAFRWDIYSESDRKLRGGSERHWEGSICCCQPKHVTVQLWQWLHTASTISPIMCRHHAQITLVLQDYNLRCTIIKQPIEQWQSLKQFSIRGGRMREQVQNSLDTWTEIKGLVK